MTRTGFEGRASARFEDRRFRVSGTGRGRGGWLEGSALGHRCEETVTQPQMRLSPTTRVGALSPEWIPGHGIVMTCTYGVREMTPAG